MSANSELLRRELAQALADAGYRPATHDGVIDALLPVVERAIAAGQAQVWGVGYVAAEQDALDQPYSDHPSAATWTPTRNPYRAASLTETEGE